ncbi:phage portal protein [Flavisphingopyxis soli]|nr:phage portal protein [Sphingorhabdus soli]
MLAFTGIYPDTGFEVASASGRMGSDMSRANICVDAETAMRFAAFFACARILASSIASLSLPLYERIEGGTRRTASEHPLYAVLHDAPNADQTTVDYFEQMVLGLLLAGDHFALKHRGTSGQLVALEPIKGRVTVGRGDRGQRLYRWHEGSSEVEKTEDDVFHVMGFGGGPLRGLSVLGAARETLGLGIAADRSAAGMFRNGMRPSGTINYDKFLDEEQYESVKQRIADHFTGADNHGRPFILEGGFKWGAVQMNADDAQLLESRKFSIEEICRFFGVPPFMIGHSEKSTSWGTGIEQQLLGFQKFTLGPWLKRIEKAIGRQLLKPEERKRFFAEFNLESLLRADTAARSTFYKEMTGIGAMTVNEVRAKENLPPIEGGEVARIQMQNVPLTDAGKGVTTNV